MQHVVISSYGAYLGKKSERLAVRKRGVDGEHETDMYIPFFRIREITIASRGVSISSTLIEECMTRGIKISFLTGNGDPLCVVSSPFLEGTVRTRRCQYEAYNDFRSVEAAREFAAAKTRNQIAVILYFGKYIRKKDSSVFQLLMEAAVKMKSILDSMKQVSGNSIDEARNTIMGYEGSASALYWGAVSHIAGETIFRRREHRGADDPFNASLNYGYGILYSRVSSCILNAGLDLYAGFLHADKSGKPSLVLDFVEEYRQPVVDRAVLTIFNKNPERVCMKDGLLTFSSRRHIAGKVLGNLDHEARYGNGNYSVNSVMQRQARRLAVFLRGEGSYRGYTFKW